MDAALILAGIEMIERLAKLIARANRGEASDVELAELRLLTASKVKAATDAIDQKLNG